MHKKILKSILVLTLFMNIFNFKQFSSNKIIENFAVNDGIKLYCILEKQD